MPTFIYRSARDLRLDDHAGLAAAVAYGDVVPLLVIDRVLAARLGRSPRRAAFFCTAVRALEAALRQRGAHLIVRRGSVDAVAKQVARATGALGIAWSAHYETAGMLHDRRARAEMEEAGLRATLVHDAPAIAPDAIALARSSDDRGYRAFAPYHDQWKAMPIATYDTGSVRFAATDLHSEPLPEPHEFGSHAALEEATPSSAHAELSRFLNETAVTYASARNVPSEDGTSRLWAHLSFGTISARSIARATQERALDPFLLSEERLSLRLYLRSLAMRDFFLQLSWYHPEIEDEPLQEKMRAFGFERTHPALDAWKSGRTGFPLIDAGIRQLHHTGWMHPHVRAVAASFLCFDLGVDWRVGRDEWDRWAIDDAPALASANWQWIAGVGANLPRYPRLYNPEKQRRRFDPSGAYVKRWVEELAHTPSPMSKAARSGDAQLALPLFGDQRYPHPVVDHEAAARGFLARYAEYVTMPEGGRRANR